MTEQLGKQLATGVTSNPNHGAYPETEVEPESDSQPDALVDANSGGTTGCSTGNPATVAPPPYLDRAAIDAAITNVILGEFPKSAPMTAAQRDGWVEVLSLLHPGELRPALAARIDDKSYRPDAYAILEIVQGQRAARTAESRRQIEARRQAERRAEMAEYQRTDACAQEAMRVFQQFAHLMPSRRVSA